MVGRVTLGCPQFSGQLFETYAVRMCGEKKNKLCMLKKTTIVLVKFQCFFYFKWFRISFFVANLFLYFDLHLFLPGLCAFEM